MPCVTMPIHARNRWYQGWPYGRLVDMMSGDAGRERSDWSAAVAAQVRAERAAAQWTREELAAASGVMKQTLMRIETGQRVADVSQVGRICAALGLPLAEFFRRVEGRAQLP